MDEDTRARAERVADLLYEDLKRFFHEKLPAEQRIRTDVQPVERTKQREDDTYVEYRLSLLFHTPTGLHLNGHFLIAHSGGNVYGVSVSIADAESKVFEISVPEFSDRSAGTAVYTHDLCMFVLREVERITGEQYLRDATKQSNE